MPFPLRSSLAVLLCLVLSGVGAAAESKERANVLVQPPRELVNSLKSAQEAAAKEHYGDAVAELRKILDTSDGDGFLPRDSLYGSQRTIEAEAMRVLDSLPAAGRQLYELQNSGEIQRSVNDAIRQGDRSALADIARRHFPSPVAADVVTLLAHDAFDRGCPLEALAWIRFLLRSSSAVKGREAEILLVRAASYLAIDSLPRAREAIGQLKAIKPPVSFRLGVEEHTSADPPERLLASLGWKASVGQASNVAAPAADWRMFRGDAARNASSKWSGPPGPRLWKAGTLDDAATKQFSTWRRTDADPVLFPCLHPLVVGNVLLARSPCRLSAYDVRSGKVLWENPPPVNLRAKPDEPNDKSEKIPDIVNRAIARNREGVKQQDQQDPNLWQRFWEDAPFGQLSSNGSEVFLIDGFGIAQSGDGQPVVIMMPGQAQVMTPKPAQPYNRLVALSLSKQGKLAWSVGGEDGGQEPQLAGYFFLGPPLPDGRDLYVLAEKDGAIRICALDAATGGLQWSLALVQPEAAILDDPVRRLAGASPSMCDGILVCPTSAGAVAAVDPATRSLLWGFQYPMGEQKADRTPRGVFLNGRMLTIKRTGINRTVRDSTAVLAAGRTFLLPVEAEQLYCLNTATGELLWSCPRDEMLFVAGVAGDKVILAGERGLFARNLQTGKSAWRDEGIELPGKSQVIGRGFMAGGFYYVPTTWNEVVKFDVHAGKIAERSPTKNPLGNITAANNRLISHTGNAIQVYGIEQ
jgi:outer membrane protein assembly factor BamB